ncbi:hypothetical protein [Streptomyces anandii]|uniref:hypothetical protein n=1 Tax=Streptomyces anandii TaxID=285454 RepID=UPI00378E195C
MSTELLNYRPEVTESAPVEVFDGPIADLEVRRPTLEDTYLHMVHEHAGGTRGSRSAGTAGNTARVAAGMGEERPT